MVSLTVVSNADEARLFAKYGPKKVREGMTNGIRKALALVQSHHKKNEWLPGGGINNPIKPHPEKLRVRFGTLRKSYTTKLAERLMRGYYGSDLKYAATHEYGDAGRGIRARPGVAKTAKATAARIEKIMADELEKALKNGA